MQHLFSLCLVMMSFVLLAKAMAMAMGSTSVAIATVHG